MVMQTRGSVEKARFDSELRRSMGGCTSGVDDGTFWTLCPYCYYVYEYDKVFEECCLKCTNVRCGRVLHAVPIGAPPPPEVVENGYYFSVGFMPFEIRNSNGEEIGANLWSPFGSRGNVREPKSDSGDGTVIDISDDEDEGIVDAETAEEMGVQGHNNEGEANGEQLESKGGHESGFMQNRVNEAGIIRKKSIPWNSTKLMGRGLVIDKNQAQSIYVDDDEWPADVFENNGVKLEPELGGEMSNIAESRVEFFEGDNDVLVGLQCDFDWVNEDCELENANIGTL